jgi:hypothetical protein
MITKIVLVLMFIYIATDVLLCILYARKMGISFKEFVTIIWGRIKYIFRKRTPDPDDDEN